jgi:hypothetical protein
MLDYNIIMQKRNQARRESKAWEAAAAAIHKAYILTDRALSIEKEKEKEK